MQNHTSARLRQLTRQMWVRPIRKSRGDPHVITDKNSDRYAVNDVWPNRFATLKRLCIVIRQALLRAYGNHLTVTTDNTDLIEGIGVLLPTSSDQPNHARGLTHLPNLVKSGSHHRLITVWGRTQRALGEKHPIR